MKDACDNVTKLCQLLHTEVCRNGGFITQISQLKIHASESSARRMTKLLGQLPPTHKYTSDVAVGTGTSKTTGKKSGIVSVLQRFPKTGVGVNVLVTMSKIKVLFFCRGFH